MTVHQEMEVESSQVLAAVEGSEDDDKSLSEKYPTEGSTCRVIVKVSGEENIQTGKDLLESVNLKLNSENLVIIGDCENSLQESVENILQGLENGECCNFEIQTKEVFEYGHFKAKIIAVKSDTGLYKLELISFENASNVNKLTSIEMFERAKHYKEIGNKLYKSHSVEMSFKKYSRALKYLIVISDSLLTENPDLKDEHKTLKCQVYLNIAACQLQCKGYIYAAENCTKVVALEPLNVKALYRRGMAYKGLGENELSLVDLEKVIELDPTNCAAKKELQNLRSHIQNQTSTLAKAMSRMFTK